MPDSKPRKQQKPSDAEIVTIIAGALAMNRSSEATAATLSPLTHLPEWALLAALTIAMSRPVRYGVTVIPSASASAAVQAQEATFRALYVLNATRRIESASDREAAINRERDFFKLHMEAASKRRTAASSVDKARARYGDDLGWYAKMDSRTSPECREANGKNFSALRVPAIGFPGSVHPHCRCRPGKRHATSQTVYGIKMEVA